jgi:hypothetical protein
MQARTSHAMSPVPPLRWSGRPAPAPLPDLPPPASDAPSVLAFSLPKAGSTMLFDLLARLSPRAGLVYLSLEDWFFAAGIHQLDQPLESASLFFSRGYCYGGFRGAPPFDVPILREARAVLLVRDPRDMLVSLYHSLAESHWIPQATAGRSHFMHGLRDEAHRRTIDEHALMACHTVQSQFERYAVFGLPWRPNVVVYRYEDVIYRKHELADDLCDWFGWSLPAEARARAAESVDVFPAEPDPTAHVRQVHPGDHRTALAADTVRRLNGVFARTLRTYGYAEETSRASGADVAPETTP